MFGFATLQIALSYRSQERRKIHLTRRTICALFAPTILTRARCLTEGENRLAYAGPIRDAAENYESILHHR